MEHTLNPKEIRYIFDDFVGTHALDLALSLTPSDYPWGLEPDGKTLHVDPREMAAMPDWAGILYLLYNLTRAWLVADPDSAPKATRATVRYDLREDGRVYKLQDGKWLRARIQGNSRAAKSLPAHVWAVEEAMAEAEELMTTEWEKDNLHSLAYMMQTGNPLSKEELDQLVELLERSFQQKMDVSQLKLRDVQPSQFYISQDKLNRVREWFDPADLRSFEPIPIKILDGIPVMTDGHTRAVAAVLAGLDAVPVVPDPDELDWDLYEEDVKACRRQGVYSPYDLVNRIVDAQTYYERWDKWCDELFERVKRQKAE